MQLFPAIDILDGKAVRLLRGSRQDVTEYGLPLEMATRWTAAGAKWLHLVDLNGAFDAKTVNKNIIRAIVDETGLCVQVGGGIRTLSGIKTYLDLGVTRVILGTAIFEERDFLREALAKFGSERIVCGLDAIDGKVAIKGWVSTIDQTPFEVAQNMKQAGVGTIVFTDISRDGAMTGINVESCKKMSDETGLDIIASGGLKSLDDIRACHSAKLYGTILGKAIYEKKFTLREAYDVLREPLC